MSFYNANQRCSNIEFNRKSNQIAKGVKPWLDGGLRKMILRRMLVSIDTSSCHQFVLLSVYGFSFLLFSFRFIGRHGCLFDGNMRGCLIVRFLNVLSCLIGCVFGLFRFIVGCFFSTLVCLVIRQLWALLKPFHRIRCVFHWVANCMTRVSLHLFIQDTFA